MTVCRSIPGHERLAEPLNASSTGIRLAWHGWEPMCDPETLPREPALSATPDILLLEQRAGLPEDLKYLLAKYPRDSWDAHPNVHGMARMWLAGGHDMFRELGGILTGAISDYREGPHDGAGIRAVFRAAPQLFSSAISMGTTMSRTSTISRSSRGSRPS